MDHPLITAEVAVHYEDSDMVFHEATVFLNEATSIQYRLVLYFDMQSYGFSLDVMLFEKSTLLNSLYSEEERKKEFARISKESHT